LFETIRLMLSEQVYDVIRTTTARVQQAGVCTLADVRQAGDLVAFSDAVRDQTRELKRFLFKALYRHPQVMETTDRARQVVVDLFAAYTDQPGQMPVEYSRRPDLARAVADYIAGMTDRFAVREHQRLTGQKLF
jgi:dGTPase